jgi:hypothetical protein
LRSGYLGVSLYSGLSPTDVNVYRLSVQHSAYCNEIINKMLENSGEHSRRAASVAVHGDCHLRAVGLAAPAQRAAHQARGQAKFARQFPGTAAQFTDRLLPAAAQLSQLQCKFF